MKRRKELLREKFIEFQLKIDELTKTLRDQDEANQAKRKEMHLHFIEILDAFEDLEATTRAQEDAMDESARRLAKSVRAIQKRVERFLENEHIKRIEFPDNKARMEYCRIVDTRQAPETENETILCVVKNGYLDETSQEVLRKAEVITVLNPT